jgi:hypothetical protein
MSRSMNYEKSLLETVRTAEIVVIIIIIIIIKQK